MVRSRVVAALGAASLVAVWWTGCGSSGDACEPVAEVCNALDDDCDGQTDEEVASCCQPSSERACGSDEGVCTAGVQTCSASGAWGPCLSGGAPAILPGDVEDACNGLDDDCDGTTDESFLVGTPCSAGVGICARSGVTVCAPSETATWCDAVPGQPSVESCNGLDDDCDGQTDEELSPPLCANQQGVCAGARTSCAGGSWAACGASQYGPDYEAVEASCDDLDNDCDGTTDEGVQATYYRDADGDTYGRADATQQACSAPPGYAARALDCNDGADTVHPGAGETCSNGIDDDCDGLTDAPACP